MTLSLTQTGVTAQVSPFCAYLGEVSPGLKPNRVRVEIKLWPDQKKLLPTVYAVLPHKHTADQMLIEQGQIDFTQGGFGNSFLPARLKRKPDNNSNT